MTVEDFALGLPLTIDPKELEIIRLRPLAFRVLLNFFEAEENFWELDFSKDDGTIALRKAYNAVYGTIFVHQKDSEQQALCIFVFESQTLYLFLRQT